MSHKLSRQGKRIKICNQITKGHNEWVGTPNGVSVGRTRRWTDAPLDGRAVARPYETKLVFYEPTGILMRLPYALYPHR